MAFLNNRQAKIAALGVTALGVKSLILILLQNPRSRNRESLRKTVPGVGGAGNNPKIFLKVEKPAASAFFPA